MRDDLKGKITWYFGSEQKYPSSAIASKRGTAPNERVHIFSAGGVIVGEKMYLANLLYWVFHPSLAMHPNKE